MTTLFSTWLVPNEHMLLQNYILSSIPTITNFRVSFWVGYVKTAYGFESKSDVRDFGKGFLAFLPKKPQNLSGKNSFLFISGDCLLWTQFLGQLTSFKNWGRGFLVSNCRSDTILLEQVVTPFWTCALICVLYYKFMRVQKQVCWSHFLEYQDSR